MFTDSKMYTVVNWRQAAGLTPVLSDQCSSVSAWAEHRGGPVACLVSALMQPDACNISRSVGELLYIGSTSACARLHFLSRDIIGHPAKQTR